MFGADARAAERSMISSAPRLLPKLLVRLRDDYPAESYRERAVLYREGSSAEVVFLLQAGIVKLHRVAGDHSMLVRLMGPGDIWGAWFEEDAPLWQESAECMRPVRAHAIPVAEFRRAISRDAELAVWVARLLARRLIETERRMALLSFHRVEQRLLYSLAELAENCGLNEGREEYALPLTQTDLASMIGATRETVSTALNALERRGLLRLGRRSLEFSSPERLRSEAAGSGQSDPNA